jgi:mRNA-degrading endonuclease RelE of RelBE toxin-antitoxin system
MKVEFSKDFEKSVRKLSGKMLSSVKDVIQEVIDAKGMDEITDCIRLSGYDYVYRIRIGNYRAFLVFHVQIVDDTVMFEYLISRGEAYDKKMEQSLRKKDK